MGMEKNPGCGGINQAKTTHDWRDDRRDSMEDSKEWKDCPATGKKSGLPRDSAGWGGEIQATR